MSAESGAGILIPSKSVGANFLAWTVPGRSSPRRPPPELAAARPSTILHAPRRHARAGSSMTPILPARAEELPPNHNAV